MSSEADSRLFAHYTISKDNSGFGEEDGDLTILLPGSSLPSKTHIEEHNGTESPSSLLKSYGPVNVARNATALVGDIAVGQQYGLGGITGTFPSYICDPSNPVPGNFDVYSSLDSGIPDIFGFDGVRSMTTPTQVATGQIIQGERISRKPTSSVPVHSMSSLLPSPADINSPSAHYVNAPALANLAVPKTKQQLQPARPSDMGPPLPLPPLPALPPQAAPNGNDAILNATIDCKSPDKILDMLTTFPSHQQTPVIEQHPLQRSFVGFGDPASSGDISMPANVPHGENNDALHPSVTGDLKRKPDNTSHRLVNSACGNTTGQAAEFYASQPPKHDFNDRIDHLRAQIHALERQKMERVPWQCEGGIAYLDQPRWRRGMGGDFLLAGTEPISDMQSYLERHSELAFVVYREYKSKDPVGSHVSTVGEPDRRSPEEGYPVPTAERLRLVSRDLIKAMHEFSKSLPSHHGINSGRPFDERNSIAAPYLLMYFHQEAFSPMTAKLPKPAQHQWEMLKSYVYQAFGAEYDEARKQFQQGFVVPRFVKYLFLPGDLLRVNHDSATDAVQALGVVKQLAEATAQNRRTEDTSRDRGDPLGDDSEEKDHKSLSWSIGAQYYNFHSWFDLADGRFTISLPVSCEPVPITHLDLYPLDYATSQLQQALEDRGKSFWKCRHRRFVEYSKGGSLRAWSGIKSRYMIDPVAYIKMHGRQDVGPRGAAEDAARGHIIDQEDCPDYPFPMLLPRTIKGYNFIEKAWLEIDVEFVSDVKWNFKAFENLVFDEETKDILEALVTHQLATEASTDLIEGKGNGLIILLHGGPGTGKTYTAESVADYAQKPLYRVTCGDIG